MRKIVFAALLSISLYGCKKEGPERSAEIFLNGFYHMDFEAAESVATDDAKGILEMIGQLSPQMVNDSVKAARKKIKVNIESSTIEGNHAEVSYTTSESNAVQKLKLVKQEDKWLVESSKLDQFDEMGVDNGVMPGEEEPGSETGK